MTSGWIVTAAQYRHKNAKVYTCIKCITKHTNYNNNYNYNNSYSYNYNNKNKYKNIYIISSWSGGRCPLTIRV